MIKRNTHSARHVGKLGSKRHALALLAALVVGLGIGETVGVALPDATQPCGCFRELGVCTVHADTAASMCYWSCCTNFTRVQ